MIDDLLEVAEDLLAEQEADGSLDALVEMDGLDTPGQLTEDELDGIAAAVARSTAQVQDAADLGSVAAYIQTFDHDPEALLGATNNIKGIHGELEVCQRLNELDDGLTYRLADSINEPDVDIYGTDRTGEVVRRVQVKVTEDPGYVRQCLSDLPADVELISGTEMSALFGDAVLDVGLDAGEIGQDARMAIERLASSDPLLDRLYGHGAFNEYVAQRGLRF